MKRRYEEKCENKYKQHVLFYPVSVREIYQRERIEMIE